MKKILCLFILFFIHAPAYADFNLVRTSDTSQGASERTGASSSTAVKPALISRRAMRPSLEIINDRYVPDSIKQKYNLTDDYVEMTAVKPAAPIVVMPKKRLEIISGPPPVMPEVAPVPQIAEAKPVPEPVPVPVNRIDTWRARQGEILKDVLKRWSERAGSDFVWTATESPKVSREYSYIGTFEKAVNGLMQQDSGTLKMKFSNEDEFVSEPVPVAAGNDDMRSASAMAPPLSRMNTWSAVSGSSLQTVLRAWAEMEGATLIWQTGDSFTVLSAVNEKSSFEEAVQALLSKYESKKNRPVGQLYKNPVSGEKVLVIKTDKAG